MKIERSGGVILHLNADEYKYLLELLGRASDCDTRTILTKRSGLTKDFIQKAIKFSYDLYKKLDDL